MDLSWCIFGKRKEPLTNAKRNSNKPLLGADNNALIALLSINLVVYALIGFFKVVYYLNSLPLEQF